MSNFQKLKKLLISKCICLNSSPDNFASSRTMIYPGRHIAQKCRFYSDRKAAKANDAGEACKVLSYVKEAQSAMLDYLHSTRTLQFMDAEHMSKNSPLFLEKLLNRMDNNVDIGRSLTRFLRFNPINEFEPLFESMGLQPDEYSAYLPRKVMFLNDDPVFMKNYHVLCEYGIERGKIGRVYMEAREIFRYDEGVLQSKLVFLGEVGLNQSMMAKLVTKFPGVLIGADYKAFLELMDKLRSLGIPYDWIEACILQEDSCKWNRMLGLVCLLRNMSCSEEQLQTMIRQSPKLLCANSGLTTFSLFSFLTKFGSTSEEICNTLLQLPQIPISKFFANLRSCYNFIVAIEMEAKYIGSIVSSHSLLLGSCGVKKHSTVIYHLGTGKKRVCELIKENPEVLKSWVYGKRIERLSREMDFRSYNMKVNFLLGLGYVENSKEMNSAIKVFRGRGEELQERFDCFVQAGLDPVDVKRMVKCCPRILTQSKDLIATKIDFLLNDVGRPLSTLLAFPSYVCYTMKRTKLRLSFYNWLKEVGVVDEKTLALSTLIACSEDIFVKTFVDSHPSGHDVWENLKKEIYHVQ